MSSNASAKPIQSQVPDQGQGLPAGLQPLFDSSISLSYDGANKPSDGSNSDYTNNKNNGSGNGNSNGNGGAGTSTGIGKADSARVLTPPSSTGISTSEPGSSVFGMLPVGGPRMSIDNALGSRVQQHPGAPSRHRTNSVVTNSGGHGRTASYGTSLLDTLNEEKHQQHQQSMGQGLLPHHHHHHHSQLHHHQVRLGHNRSATAAGTDIIGGVLGSGHQQHHRHFTLSSPSPFSLLTQSDSLITAKPSSSSMSPPNATAAIGLAHNNGSSANANSSSANASDNGGPRMAAHMRSHTLAASPPGLLKQPLPTNASGMLGAHARLGSLSGASAALQPSSSSSLVGGSLLSSSALRSSYSSNSLRSAFAHRSSPSPSPLGGGVGIGANIDQISVSSPASGASVPAAGGIGIGIGIGNGGSAAANSTRSFDFSSSLNDGVWGPSGLSTELDILATPNGSSGSGHISLADAMAGLTVESALGHMGMGGGDAASRGHSRSGSFVAGGVSAADAYARIRSYSFNSPPDGIEGPDEPDIDVLHAAAKAQNPSLAFRKLMARTHARSKTMSNPFESAGDSDVAMGQPATRAGGYAHQHHQAHMRNRMSTAGLEHLHGSSSLASLHGAGGGGHSRQQSESDVGATVHLGIGGEAVLPAFPSTSLGAAGSSVPLSAASAGSMLQQQQQQQHQRNAAAGAAPGSASSSSANSALLNASHSRQPSMHTRQHSMDFDYASAMHAAAGSSSSSSDGVPTRSLWVGN
ncbi:hypothetical protein LPJ75_003461, partial [Coemansia sp. RSA 2598]